MNIDANFESKFNSYVEGCRKIYNDYMVAQFPNYPENCKEKLVSSFGKRYARVDRVRVDDEKRQSVFAFVDMTNGDVLKPASYKVPAKHARGNIYDESNGLKYMTAYGPAYLR